MENLFSTLLHDEYTGGELNETSVDPNPFTQFQHWLQEAVAAGLPEPNAMTLATVDGEGRPSARVVLLKEFDESGFVFYSNYTSAKAGQLKENPYAALVFLWHRPKRQVRIEGWVDKISRMETEAYFRSRPYGARLSALISRQSQVVASRRVLEERCAEMDRRFAGGEVPLPKHWGGYRVTPVMMEFWQGRPNRLHDRLRYRLQESGVWLLERLEP